MRGYRFIFLLFAVSNYLCFAFAQSPDLNHSSSQSTHHLGFDLFLLVRTWPPTFCEQLQEFGEECSKPPLGELTIHGLWPEYSSGGWPQYCTTFTQSSLQSIENDTNDAMACQWPSFHGTDEDFYAHEYNKHGTCASSLFKSRDEYFNTTIQLHQKYDLNALFQSHGILSLGTNNKQESVTTAKAASVIQEEWNVEPRFSCHKGSLSEVWLCLDTELNPVDCPPRVKPGEQCGQIFGVPPGQTQIPRWCQKYFPRGTSSTRRKLVLIGCIVLVGLMGGALVCVLAIEKRTRRKREKIPGGQDQQNNGDSADEHQSLVGSHTAPEDEP